MTAAGESGVAAVAAPSVGVVGARGFVGRRVCNALSTGGHPVVACTREPGVVAGPSPASLVRWHPLGGPPLPVRRWIAVCPLWCLPEWLPWLESCGVERLVAVSSTSRFTKSGSADAGERATAERLASAEAAVVRWAEGRSVVATILRPTLIYDGLHDRNVARIAGFVRRWGFFPLVGGARGVRQPVHVDDVASACVAAVGSGATGTASYALSGGESLTYREMVSRIFRAAGLRPRFVSLPRWVIRPGIRIAGRLGVGGVTVGMFDRMNEDLVFDHAGAARDLGFRPRPFALPVSLPSDDGGSDAEPASVSASSPVTPADDT